MSKSILKCLLNKYLEMYRLIYGVIFIYYKFKRPILVGIIYINQNHTVTMYSAIGNRNNL